MMVHYILVVVRVVDSIFVRRCVVTGDASSNNQPNENYLFRILNSNKYLLCLILILGIPCVKFVAYFLQKLNTSNIGRRDATRHLVRQMETIKPPRFEGKNFSSVRVYYEYTHCNSFSWGNGFRIFYFGFQFLGKPSLFISNVSCSSRVRVLYN